MNHFLISPSAKAATTFFGNYFRHLIFIVLIFPVFLLSAEPKSPPKPSPQPYIIYRGNIAGFWSNFFWMLGGIDVADKKGWIPVVDMERYSTDYTEKVPVLNTRNSWEYFFHQPGDLALAKALKMNFVDSFGKNNVFTYARSITPPPEKIKRGRALINKYIKIKQYILDELDGYIPAGLHFDILGVHVRGTDRHQGCPNHLRTANPEVYLEKAIALDRTYQFSKIFLACDEKETVELFQDVFADRLIVTDAYRPSTSIHKGNFDYLKKDWLFKDPRPLHRYLLGKEVLIDALLLARAGHLLCGPSNVSHAAIFFANGNQIIHEVPSPGMF